MSPDIHEALLANVACGKRKLDTGKNVAVWRNVAGSMSSAAGPRFEVIFARLRGNRAKFFDISNQLLITKNLAERAVVDRESKSRTAAVHHGRDCRVERALDAKFVCQRAHAGIVLHILSHQNIGHDDLQPLRFQKTNRGQRTLQRSRNQGDGVVHLGAMRVDADLYRFHAEIANALRLALADEHSVRFELYADNQTAGVLQNLKQNTAPHQFPPP